MEFVNVLVAAIVAWVFGAIWYGSIAKSWMAASGLTEDMIDRKDFKPYIISLIMAILSAGMLRHVLVMSGVTDLGKSFLVGIGLGAFVALPWMVNNVMYSLRNKSLIWMDGAYPVIGMGLMGIVLALF